MMLVVAQGISLSIEQIAIILVPLVGVIAWLIRLEARANQSATREEMTRVTGEARSELAEIRGELHTSAATTKGSLDSMAANHTAMQHTMARIEQDNKNSNHRMELKIDSILVAALRGARPEDAK